MRIIIFVVLVVLSINLTGCNTQQEAAKERRNLMMPDKTDLPRNNKYKAPKSNKKYKSKSKKKYK